MQNLAKARSPQQVRNKIAEGERLRILFINDMGFQYGAGIALLRQIQSFLVMGHEVTAISWVQGDIEGSVPLVPNHSTGQWLGISCLPYLHVDQGISQDCIVDTLVLEAKLRNPDVIIVGNLHGAKWSLKLLPALKLLGCIVVAFMHDCYLLTGRCAYFGDCHLYEIGCNNSCPTWEKYPSLEPDKIFDEWVLRRQIFCGSDGIPLAANSQWTLKMAQKAFKNLCNIECLYYGLDAQLFKQIDKSLARHLLGIPQDCFVILSGAVDVTDRRKGGHIFNELVPKLQEKVHFLLFGAHSQNLENMYGTGLLRDYRKMPLVYSAADVFIGTSLEEAFGQTFCEAAACSLPSIAFRIDGVPEVARHNTNARLAKDVSVESLLEEVKFFMDDPARRREFGEAGRAMVEAEFTLKCQGDRWIEYLRNLALTS